MQTTCESRQIYRMHPSGPAISSLRRPEKDIIDKGCPGPSDKITRDFVFPSEALDIFPVSPYCSMLESVLNWMKVKSCILYRRN